MVEFELIPEIRYKNDYPAIFTDIADGKLEARPTYRELCRTDLFFLLYFGLEQTYVHDSFNPRLSSFVVRSCQEVEDDDDNTLDLWAREHFKSTLRTYGQPIQDLIKNQEERIGLFSHTRPIAKGFLRQIKTTLERRDLPLKLWFTDVFYFDPKKQAPKWSEDDGLVIKRRGTPKESSIEAWGLVDGQPTSKHFSIRIYDDCVTRESVTTPEMIRKTDDAFELSHSLGTEGGKKRVVGTTYHFADMYCKYRAKSAGEDLPPLTPQGRFWISAKNYKVREKPATEDGTAMGAPVMLSQERLDQLRIDQGPYTFSSQQLMNPVAAENQKFDLGWVKYYDKLPSALNKYLLCDPANEKAKKSDDTVMAVIGVDAFMTRYLLDLLRDKLNLGERWKALRDMYRRNSQGSPILRVGYEKYGKDSDIQYYEEKQRDEGTYFDITPLGGPVGKYDRIYRLVPIFESGKFYLPLRPLLYTTVEGKTIDMVKVFLDEEYIYVPYATHDDIFDCISRSEDADMDMVPPMIAEEKDLEPEYVGDY